MPLDREGYGHIGPEDDPRYKRGAEEAAKFPTKKARTPRIVSRGRPRSADSVTPDPEVIVEEVEVPVGGGNNSQYVTPNYETHVFIALSLSLLFTLLSAYGRQKEVNAGRAKAFLDPKTDPIKFATGWVAIFIVLLAMARFRGTDRLAAAFAWLIFVAVLLINGEQALALVKSPTYAVVDYSGKPKPLD